MSRKIKGYLCEVAWDHELGEDLDGTVIYPDIESLKLALPCWEECGIVEVEITGKTIIEPVKEK